MNRNACETQRRLRRTKGGSNDTEPAYVIARKNCCRWVAVVIATLLLAVVYVWRSDQLLKRLSPRLAAHRSALRLKQHSSHSRFTKLGQEFEQHLEMDMRERERALILRGQLRALEQRHRTNVTRALDAAAIGSEDFTFEAKAALRPYLDGAIEELFRELRDVVEARLVAPMLAAGASAYDRHVALHDEILTELRKDQAERARFLDKSRNIQGDHDGDGFVEDKDLDGDADRRWADELYDEESVERQDEEWRQEMIQDFVENYNDHFNDTLDKIEPRALLTTSDVLYKTLRDLHEQLGYDPPDPSTNRSAPTISWRQAEERLADLKPQLQKHRCHTFEPSDPPQDDEYDYMQLHHVEHYLTDMLWHAKLNDAKSDIDGLLRKYDAGDIPSMDLMERLETLETQLVFPAWWLYHGFHLDDFRYGDW